MKGSHNPAEYNYNDGNDIQRPRDLIFHHHGQPSVASHSNGAVGKGWLRYSSKYILGWLSLSRAEADRILVEVLNIFFIKLVIVIYWIICMWRQFTNSRSIGYGRSVGWKQLTWLNCDGRGMKIKVFLKLACYLVRLLQTYWRSWNMTVYFET